MISKVEQDAILLRALVRAEAWRRSLVAGEFGAIASLADAEHLAATYVQRVLRLAFLAPDLKLAILAGQQPEAFTMEKIMRADLPLDWAEQRLAFLSGYTATTAASAVEADLSNRCRSLVTLQID